MREWTWQSKACVNDLLVYTLMPFKGTDDLYKCIKKAGTDQDLVVKRGDEGGKRQVINEIVEGIAESRIIVADLTGGNPNVCYELGLCDILGKDVILLAQDAKETPFNFRADRIIEYKMSELDTLREKLAFYHLLETSI